MEVSAQREGAGGFKTARISRTASVSIRYGKVTLDAPRRSGAEKGASPRTVWAVYAREDHPPKTCRPPGKDAEETGVEPIDWMLVCSEPVESVEAAHEAIDRYSKRWVIEEWHKALKQGCRLESSQLDHAEDIERLAAVLSVVAVRLIQLRDLASDASKGDPAALRRIMPETWINVVAIVSKIPRAELTPQQFWLAIARKGGHLGRKSDGRPGWKNIFQGWYDFSQMVQYAETSQSTLHSCG